MGDTRHVDCMKAAPNPVARAAANRWRGSRPGGLSAQVIARRVHCRESVPSGQDGAAEAPCPATLASDSFAAPREEIARGPSAGRWARHGADLQRRIELARRPTSRKQVATEPDFTASGGCEREPVLAPPAKDESVPGVEADEIGTPRAGVASESIASQGLQIIVDTGCGEHIMSEADAIVHGRRWIDRAAAGRVFQGAGKNTTTRWTVPYDIPELQETPEFGHEAVPTPHVGWPALHGDGVHFHVEAGSEPVFHNTPRNGGRIDSAREHTLPSCRGPTVPAAPHGRGGSHGATTRGHHEWHRATARLPR